MFGNISKALSGAEEGDSNNVEKKTRGDKVLCMLMRDGRKEGRSKQGTVYVNERWKEGRKKQEARAYKQRKAKQHNTPKAVTKQKLPGYLSHCLSLFSYS